MAGRPQAGPGPRQPLIRRPGERAEARYVRDQHGRGQRAVDNRVADADGRVGEGELRGEQRR
jgi:hypothetical protein